MTTKTAQETVLDLAGQALQRGDWVIVLDRHPEPRVVASGQVEMVLQGLSTGRPWVALSGDLAAYNPTLCLKVDLARAVATARLEDLVTPDLAARLAEIAPNTFGHAPF